jgi:hypothetical protein
MGKFPPDGEVTARQREEPRGKRAAKWRDRGIPGAELRLPRCDRGAALAKLAA